MSAITATRIGQNPFTPRSGQEPKAFLGRGKELGVFSKHLEKAEKGRCDHFVVVGGWGTGKTTLLKEFRKIAQSRTVLSSYVAVHEFSSADLLPPVVQLLTHIPRNLPIRFDRLRKFTRYLQGVGITLPVIGGGFEISEKKQFDGDPQVLLLEGLLHLWHEIKEQTDVLLILLDDVQHYDSVRHVLGILKNVLSDDDSAGKTGYLVTLAATEEGWSADCSMSLLPGNELAEFANQAPICKLCQPRGSSLQLIQIARPVTLESKRCRVNTNSGATNSTIADSGEHAVPLGFSSVTHPGCLESMLGV